MNTESSNPSDPTITPPVPDSPASRRKWLIVAAMVLCVILSGIVGIALLNLGKLIESNQALIFAQIDRALGRKVEAKELKVQIWGGIGFRLSGVSIADDPSYSSQTMIAADDLSFDVVFWPLLKKELQIEQLVVHRPVVRVVRRNDGQFNVAALGTGQPASAESEVESTAVQAPTESTVVKEPPDKAPAPAEKPSEPSSAFQISSLHIKEGLIIYRDAQNDDEYQLKQFDLQVEDFGLDRAMAVRLECAVFAEQSNIKISGKLGPLGTKPDAAQSPFDLQIVLTEFPLDRLEKIIPDLKKRLHFPAGLEASGTVSADTRLQGPVSRLSVQGQLVADRMQISLKNRFEKPSGAQLQLDADAGYENGKFLIKEARLQLQSLALIAPAGAAEGDYHLQNVNLSIRDYGADRPSTIAVEAAVFSERTNLRITGLTGPPGPQWEWKQIPVDVNTVFDELPLDRIAAFIPDWKQKFSVPKELRIEGPFTLDAQIKGTVNALSIQGRMNADRMHLAYGDRFSKSADTPLNVSADAQYEHGAIKVNQCRIKLHTMDLDASGELKQGAQDTYSIEYRLARMELPGWERLIPRIESYRLAGAVASEGKIIGELRGKGLPQLAGTLNLENIRAAIPQFSQPLADLNAAITFEGRKVTTRDMRWTIGRSAMTLNLAADNLWPLDGDIEFTAPEIQVADLGVRNQSNARPEILRQVKIAGQARAVNGDTNFQGKITSSDGIVAEVEYKQLDADITLFGKTIEMPKLTVRTFDGDVEASGMVAWKTESPQFTLKSTVRNIDMDIVARAGDPQTKPKFHGRLDAGANLSGRGRDAVEIRSTLAGDVQVQIHDGTYDGVNFVRAILSPLTKVAGIQSIFTPLLGSKTVDFLNAPDTVFEEINGNATIGNQQVAIETLKIAAKDWTIQGKGTVDFEKRVDAEGVLTIAPRFLTSIADSIKELKPLTESDEPRGIPFLLKGTLPNLTPLPDAKGLVKSFPKMLLETAGGVGGSAKNILESVGGLIPGVGGEKAAGETSEATQEESAAKKLEEGFKSLFGGGKK